MAALCAEDIRASSAAKSSDEDAFSNWGASPSANQ